jgi:hypothetical protein
MGWGNNLHTILDVVVNILQKITCWMWEVDLLLSQEHPHQHIAQQVLDEEQ